VIGWERLCAAMDRGLPGRKWTPADDRAVRRLVDEHRDRRSIDNFARTRLALANATSAPRCVP